MNSPRDVLERTAELTQVWESLRPNKTFFGLTLEQFKAAARPSHDERAALADLRGQTKATKTRCHDADVKLVEVIQGVINAIKGDPQEGEDGEVYVALGYVRRSSRYGGRPRRRGNGDVPPQMEMKPQTEVKQQNGVA